MFKGPAVRGSSPSRHGVAGNPEQVGKHLFSGDTLFPGGPGKTRSPEAFQQIIGSITSKLLTLSDDTAVYPGHGLDTTIGNARGEYQAFASRQHPSGLSGEVTWSS